MLPTVPTAYTQRFVTGLIHNLTAYKHNFTGYFTGLLWICRFPPAHPRRLRYWVDCRMFPGYCRGDLSYSSSSSSSSCCCSCSAINSLAHRFASMGTLATLATIARYAREKSPPTALALWWRSRPSVSSRAPFGRISAPWPCRDSAPPCGLSKPPTRGGLRPPKGQYRSLYSGSAQARPATATADCTNLVKGKGASLPVGLPPALDKVGG